MLDAAGAERGVIAGVVVGLQEAVVLLQKAGRVDRLAGGGELEVGSARIVSPSALGILPGAVGNIRPQSHGSRSRAALLQQLQNRVVGKQHRSSEHVLL